MLRPMLPLAFSVAILDEHIRLARHEIGTSLLAALGATVSRSIATIVRYSSMSPNLLHMYNENGFARAFGGDGGTCECRGDAPQRIPLQVKDSSLSFSLIISISDTP